MPSSARKKQTTKSTGRTPSARVVKAAEQAVEDHPELIERLHEGDPGAIADLLEAGGGHVGQVTVKLVSGHQTAAG